MVDRLVQGKGTTTTSKALKVTKGLLVGLRHPFAQGSFQTLGKRQIHGTGLAEMDIVALDIEGYCVTSLQMEQAAHRFGCSSILNQYPPSFRSWLHIHGIAGAAGRSVV